MEILLELEGLIAAKEKYLERYASIESSNDYAFDKTYSEYKKLVCIYNELSQYKYFEVWKDAEKSMERMQLLDKQLAGFKIVIALKPDKYNFGYLPYNLYRDERN